MLMDGENSSNSADSNSTKESSELQRKAVKRKIEDGENNREEPKKTSTGPNSNGIQTVEWQTKESFTFSASPSLEEIRAMQKKFIEERDWDQFHAPRNVLLAMVGEVGEVAELFQWRGEVKTGLPDWSAKDKKHLGQELSDVLLYLVDLAERCNIDLPKEVVAKLAHNAAKYPADKVKGSSKKYTEYE